ncbi:MAG: nucleoside deaminase [Chloroflexota bacterium]
MRIVLTIPTWLREELARPRDPCPDLVERMRFVIALARQNMEHATGGPFAAAVYEADTGRLVAAGVNRVVPMHCSTAHAEVMALALAQKRLGTFDLGARGLPRHQLVVSWRPCVLCYGAVLWSGVRSLAIAGSGDAMERLTGFDEGPLHPRWREELAARGIELVDNVLPEEAMAVFEEFQRRGALVYNARREI